MTEIKPKTVPTAFAMPTRPLRNSAKALIIENNQVLCTCNRDLLGDFFLLPGGGQNHGETLVDAVVRECLEEVGAHVEVGHLHFVREYISANHELAEYDDTIHQIEFVFTCRLKEPVHTHAAVGSDAMQTGVVWLPINQLQNYRFYPGSLIRHLQNFMPADCSCVYLGDTL
ncbi:NUDIX domain-containing protein [Erysipelotrichia bacterium]